MPPLKHVLRVVLKRRSDFRFSKSETRAGAQTNFLRRQKI